MTNKIIVTGANGQLGSCLRDLSPTYPQYEFVFTDIEQLDITDRPQVRALLQTLQPCYLINAAAYTAVDKAESDQATAKLLNATAVEILAQESARIGAAIVQISTDYVFDGQTQCLLTEEMPTNPQSTYGLTKLEGEQAAALNPHHIILRTSWLYSAYGNNFVKTMRRLGAEKTEIGVVADQWGSPTLADDLAQAIMTAITQADQTNNNVYGLYHFSNQGATCWADFAQQIMNLSNLNCKVNHLTTTQYPTPAKRPAFSVMNKNKFTQTFQTQIPEWEESLEKLIAKLEIR